MGRPTVLVIGFATAALITGCDSGIFGTGCDLSLEPALRVDVVDSVSGAGVLAAQGARVVARDGAYADTAAVSSGQAFLAAGRGGTYAVTVEHPEYRPWSRSDVQVREGRCDRPDMVVITARLQRAP